MLHCHDRQARPPPRLRPRKLWNYTTCPMLSTGRFRRRLHSRLRGASTAQPNSTEHGSSVQRSAHGAAPIRVHDSFPVCSAAMHPPQRRRTAARHSPRTPILRKAIPRQNSSPSNEKTERVPLHEVTSTNHNSSYGEGHAMWPDNRSQTQRDFVRAAPPRVCPDCQCWTNAIPVQSSARPGILRPTIAETSEAPYCCHQARTWVFGPGRAAFPKAAFAAPRHA